MRNCDRPPPPRPDGTGGGQPGESPPPSRRHSLRPAPAFGLYALCGALMIEIDANVNTLNIQSQPKSPSAPKGLKLQAPVSGSDPSPMRASLRVCLGVCSNDMAWGVL